MDTSESVKTEISREKFIEMIEDFLSENQLKIVNLSFLAKIKEEQEKDFLWKTFYGATKQVFEIINKGVMTLFEILSEH